MNHFPFCFQGGMKKKTLYESAICMDTTEKNFSNPQYWVSSMSLTNTTKVFFKYDSVLNSNCTFFLREFMKYCLSTTQNSPMMKQTTNISYH